MQAWSSQVNHPKIYIRLTIIYFAFFILSVTASCIWLFRYREVISFTIAELATSSKHSLIYWGRELVKTLAVDEVDEELCIKLMFQYSQSMEIGKLLADELSHYITTRRPKLLEFVIPDDHACPAQLSLLLGAVKKHHQGELRLHLHHSCLHYDPCDVNIYALAGARWDIIPDKTYTVSWRQATYKLVSYAL